MSNLSEKIKKHMNSIGKGHDYRHIERVVSNALRINEFELEDTHLVTILALIHDRFDEKFYQGDFDQDFKELLKDEHLTEEELSLIKNDLKNFGFKGGIEVTQLSKVGQIVSDADRLDAMGAIGIARAMMYGDELFDPDVIYKPIITKEEYRKPRSILFHFYDKLLKLKDLMYTETGKKLAHDRHQFMVAYLERLEQETGYKVK